MANLDPYDDWKEQGRPGGSFSAWQASKSAPAPAPAAPTNFPAPPSAAPAPTPGASWQSSGTGSDAAVNEANAAYRAGQRGSDPNAIYGQGGATDFRRWYNQQQGGNRPEDLERFSDQVLAQWDQYMVKEGPNKGKYRSMRGAPGFFDKPTECPPGMVPSGPDETDPCVGGGGGGAGGGGGTGGAGAMDASTGSAGAGAGSGIAGDLEANLRKMLAGGDSRYNPEAMQGLLAQIKQRIESSKSNQLRQAESEAAGRGMSRSGRTGTNLAAIRRGAEAEFTGQYGNTLRAKIDADRQDKLDAIDRSQKYLDSLRDEMYRRDMSAIQRQQFKANLDLAYANIAAQRSNLMLSQQHSRDMLGAQFGYQSVFGG